MPPGTEAGRKRDELVVPPSATLTGSLSTSRPSPGKPGTATGKGEKKTSASSGSLAFERRKNYHGPRESPRLALRIVRSVRTKADSCRMTLQGGSPLEPRPRESPMARKFRLHKYIANCGYTSRRRAELLIQAGRVEVNGKVVDTPGTSVFPGQDIVTVNGDRIELPEPLTVIFHKPPGVITSTHDTHDRLTVMDLLPRRFRDEGVFPVGRLDLGTEGLLLLTNDGDLGHRIAHPSHQVEKEYVALVEGRPSRDRLDQFERGIVIEGQKTAPAAVVSVEPAGRNTRVTVVIGEGRKRQVRRMFEALGHPVLELERIRIGGLELGDLPRGKWRALGDAEIRLLFEPGKIL